MTVIEMAKALNETEAPRSEQYRGKAKGRFCKRAVLANVPCSGFGGPGLSKIIVFFCQGTFSGKKALTSGSSLEFMKEQVLAAFRSWWV